MGRAYGFTRNEILVGLGQPGDGKVHKFTRFQISAFTNGLLFSSCFFMSTNAPRVLLQIIFSPYIPLAEKVCGPPLINPFSVSAGLLNLPAPSLFLWLDQRNGTNYLSSSGTLLQLQSSRKLPFQSASSLILVLLILSFFIFILYFLSPCNFLLL